LIPRWKRDSPIWKRFPHDGAGEIHENVSTLVKPLQQTTTMLSRGSVRPWPEGEAVLEAVTNALPGYLMGQRWYPAKDLALPRTELKCLAPLQIPGLRAALAIWRASVGASAEMDLFIPIALHEQTATAGSAVAEIVHLANGGCVVDALSDDSFIRAFVRLMAAGHASPSPTLLAGRTAGLARLRLDEDVHIQRSNAEQSNSSIRIGDDAMLKVFRRLTPGVHPELEMGQFLTEVAHFQSIAAMLGWINFTGATVAVLQAFVSNQGDGWSWISTQLQHQPLDISASQPWIRTLGSRTAEMHVALATPTSEPAFKADLAQPADWERWTGYVEDTANEVVRALGARRADLDEASRSIANAFNLRLGELLRLLHQLRAKAIPAQITRHHGDYHLGQVLVSGEEDVTIVDFEGEPLRDLDERRAKQIPLRDVAGMLRSFSYAAAVAERELSATLAEPHRKEEIARLREWVAISSSSFLDTYFSARDRASAPLERDEALELIRFFSIEKALYEVRYELANRPGWVDIPLASILALLDQAQRAAESRRSSSIHRHNMPFGAQLSARGGVRFRLWAPKHEQIQLVVGTRGPAAMDRTTGGWHERIVEDAAPGSRYRFLLPHGTAVPDPASRFQPEDVHGPSEVIDPSAYQWRAVHWAGRPWHEAVIYEIHIGAFTEEGTFRAAMRRLDYLQDLGITAIEIMPIADFPGARNWGYDGVMLYAPDSSYGRPDDFKALIDAAHERGLLVFLDVVYNHFGPDGNYLPAYAPEFFTERHKTPWGAAMNFDGPGSSAVREFIIHNALYWLEEFQLDGLRLDAVHAILDDSTPHLLKELATRARRLDHPVHLILENEDNRASLLTRSEDGSPKYFTAQWNDDVHHVLHVAATGEGQGYYADYRADTEMLGRALAEGFAFQGQVMSFRGAPRGESSVMLSPGAFIAFIQNHDQIGNRAFGERITALASGDAVRAMAAIYLLLPQVPMLFMGEEWAAMQPFPFFSNFGGDVGRAVQEGRRQEFSKFPEFQNEESRARIPDPEAERTFHAAKLNWQDLRSPKHAAWHDYYRCLLAVRRKAVMPRLPTMAGHAGRFHVIAPGAVVVRWTFARGELVLAANLSADEQSGFPAPSGRSLWREGTVGTDGSMGPWSVNWSICEREAE
jgi:malto-oligosyltrehalose trehalohydrolase